jgi:putative serine protease PepD
VIALLVIVALLACLIGVLVATRSDGSAAAPATSRPSAGAGASGASPTTGAPRVDPPIPGNTEEPIADVAKAVAPSVVLIDTNTGEGSGIVYDASGLIVTNAHVLEGASGVQVTLADGEVYANAEVVGSDTRRDIAVVRIKPDKPLTPAVFGRTDDVRVGQVAVAIGSPFGLEQTVTAGIVSAVGRVVQATNPVEMLQTDAPINPGNSGGPLADRQGRVIGMNTSIRTAGGGGSVGVGFAIPSDTVRIVADRILKGQSLDVAFLGVRGDTPTTGSAGVILTEVRSGTPAAQAGMKVGDLITAIDGTNVSTMAGLSARIQLHQPGDAVTLTVQRDGKEQQVTVTLGTTPN